MEESSSDRGGLSQEDSYGNYSCKMRFRVERRTNLMRMINTRIVLLAVPQIDIQAVKVMRGLIDRKNTSAIKDDTSATKEGFEKFADRKKLLACKREVRTWKMKSENCNAKFAILTGSATENQIWSF